MNMNKLYFFLIAVPLFLIDAVQGFSQQYFPMTVGTELTFTNYDKNGKFDGYYIQKVVRQEGDYLNGSVKYIFSFFDEDRKPFYGGANEVEMDVKIENGTAVATMYEMKKALKAKDVFSKGDVSSIPYDLKVGMKIEDGLFVIKVGSFKATIATDHREVLAQKKITTKAGTFDCFQVKEHQITKVVGRVETTSITWYAKNLGSVKQEVYDSKGRLICTQELTGFKQ